VSNKKKSVKVLENIADAKEEAAKRRLKGLSKDGWSVIQLFLQEIQANDLVSEVVGGTKVTLTNQIEALKERIQFEFEDDEEVKKLIMANFPTYNTIRRWTKAQGWQDAVYGSIKYANLFDNYHKAKVIDGVYRKATADGRQDMKAAELYFKIEADVFGKNKDKGSESLQDELTNVVLGKKKSK